MTQSKQETMSFKESNIKSIFEEINQTEEIDTKFTTFHIANFKSNS